jgi:hypothetical protein
MALIYGEIETLNRLWHELQKKGIRRFTSIVEIENFKRFYLNEKEEIYFKYEQLYSEEKELLQKKLEDSQRKLEELTEKQENIVELLDDNKTQILKVRNIYLRYFRLFSGYIQKLKTNKIAKDYIFYCNNKKLIVNKNSKHEIRKFDSIYHTIDSLQPLIAGMSGEKKVVEEIRKLSNDFILINDFSINFNPPLYKKEDDDRIYSIQIDHLVISRSGIFILETKNWSQRTVNSNELRSPVVQIQRSGYAFYRLMKYANQRNNLINERNIPIRNVIVMTGAKPWGEYDKVAIKSTAELNSYLKSFRTVLGDQELSDIRDYLLDINHSTININISRYYYSRSDFWLFKKIMRMR